LFLTSAITPERPFFLSEDAIVGYLTVRFFDEGKFFNEARNVEDRRG